MKTYKKNYIDSDGYFWTTKIPKELEYSKYIGSVKIGLSKAKVYTFFETLIVEKNGYYCEIQILDKRVYLHKKICDELLISL